MRVRAWSALLPVALLSLGCSSDPGGVPGGEIGTGGDAATSGVGGASVAAGVGGGGGATPVPQPESVAPCDEGTCWDTHAMVAECGYLALEEDFASGNYNVHRYASRLWADTETEIVLSRDSGMWDPALVLAELDGATLFDGSIGATTDSIQVTVLDDGVDSSTVHLRIVSSETVDVDVFVTGWQVVDSGFTASIPQDATYTLTIDDECDSDPIDVIAPAGTLAGEVTGTAGNNAIEVVDGTWGAPLRFDIPASTHVGFRLEFSPGGADVDMQVLSWDGAAASAMALTNGGDGERVLAVLDAKANRTFWVRARGDVDDATLVATFTPFDEAAQCQSDCATLLQLPLPMSALSDGYDMAGGVVYRYQFGRRDLLMALRHAGRAVAAAGIEPFTVEDISKAGGLQPPGHASHDFGKDVDLSLYNADGHASWEHLCTATSNSECVPGTDGGFNGPFMARKIAAFLDSDRVTFMFLDEEFHPALLDAAQQLVDDGELDAWQLTAMSDVVTHWPNHHGHIHVRFSVDP